MLLGLCVKRSDMKDFAQHGPFLEVNSLEDFCNLPDVIQIVSSAKRFGDKVRVMEYVDSLTKPNKLVKELVL